MTWTGTYEAAGEWQRVLCLLAELRMTESVAPDSRTCAAALSACVRAGKWQLALCLWHGFWEEGIRPDVVAVDSVISACASSELWALGRFFLRYECEHGEHKGARSALQFLWALAELGVSDELVIDNACCAVARDFASSSWTADDVALYAWSATMLGVSSAALSRSIAKLLGSADSHSVA